MDNEEMGRARNAIAIASHRILPCLGDIALYGIYQNRRSRQDHQDIQRYERVGHSRTMSLYYQDKIR